MLKKELILLILSALFLSSCGGVNAGKNEIWTLVGITLTGEKDQVIVDKVDVSNCCGRQEKKTVFCSAGTERDVSIAIGGGIGLDVGVTLNIDPQVAITLGVNQDSGESLELDVPPDDFAYQYTVIKNYTVKSGDAILRSSSGKEKSAPYSFTSDCSLTIQSNEQISCQQSCQAIGTPLNSYYVNHQDYMSSDLDLDVNENELVCLTTGPIFILNIQETIRFPGNGRASVVCWIGPQRASATDLAGSSLKNVIISSGNSEEIAIELMREWANEMVTRPDGCGVNYGPCKVADLALIYPDGTVLRPDR